MCGGPTTKDSTPPSDTGVRRNSPNRDSSSKNLSNTPLPIHARPPRSGNPANNVPGSRPQDHKPAQGKPRTVTVKGLVLTLDPAKLNDWELMESLYDLQSDPQNNALSVVPFLRGMFSAKDYGRIKNRLRDHENGRITGDAKGEFLQELFERLNEESPNS